jgi:hypothetical protein
VLNIDRNDSDPEVSQMDAANVTMPSVRVMAPTLVGPDLIAVVVEDCENITACAELSCLKKPIGPKFVARRQPFRHREPYCPTSFSAAPSLDETYFSRT